MLDKATPTLRERLLSKIVMPGPATPCATWVGAYNIDGRRTGRKNRGERPVIHVGGRGSPVRYVAPLLLEMHTGLPADAGDPPLEAAHRCAWGAPIDGRYRCVDLRCLRWATRAENEADKYE